MKPVINYIDPRNLKPHPLNAKVYGDHANEKFVESCRKGIKEHLHITPDNIIISGHRRHNAATRIGLETVPVIVRTDLTDPLDIEEALLLANDSREKTVEQKAREFQELNRIESERAKKRQISNLKKGGSPVGENFSQREKQGENGKSREIAAAKVGMSGPTAAKAAKVVNAIDEAEAKGDTETAAELRETLNNKSVSAAHKKAIREEQTIRHVLDEELAEPSPEANIKELRKPFTGLVNKIGEVIAEFERMAEKPGGEFINDVGIQEMRTKGRNLQEVIKARRSAVHKPCGGKGCKTCENRGYIKEG